MCLYQRTTQQSQCNHEMTERLHIRKTLGRVIKGGGLTFFRGFLLYTLELIRGIFYHDLLQGYIYISLGIMICRWSYSQWITSSFLFFSLLLHRSHHSLEIVVSRDTDDGSRYDLSLVCSLDSRLWDVCLPGGRRYHPHAALKPRHPSTVRRR